MLKLVYTPAQAGAEDISTEADICLLNEKDHPTAALLALAALEIGLDICVGTAAFFLWKLLRR